MTAVSKNVYFVMLMLLGDIVNKYNNTVHRTIKMKPIDVTSNSYAESWWLCQNIKLQKHFR